MSNNKRGAIIDETLPVTNPFLHPVAGRQRRRPVRGWVSSTTRPVWARQPGHRKAGRSHSRPGGNAGHVHRRPTAQSQPERGKLVAYRSPARENPGTARHRGGNRETRALCADLRGPSHPRGPLGNSAGGKANASGQRSREQRANGDASWRAPPSGKRKASTTHAGENRKADTPERAIRPGIRQPRASPGGTAQAIDRQDAGPQGNAGAAYPAPCRNTFRRYL